MKVVSSRCSLDGEGGPGTYAQMCSRIASEAFRESDAEPPLGSCGGEFFELSGKSVQAYHLEAASIFSENIDRSTGGAVYVFGKARVLSVTNNTPARRLKYSKLFVKRLGAQPPKPKNVREDDMALPLWHLPADKRYGIRHLYERTSADVPEPWGSRAGDGPRIIGVGTRGGCFGVARETPINRAHDVSLASRGKLRFKR